MVRRKGHYVQRRLLKQTFLSMSEINQTYYTMAKACELLQDELCSHIENIKPLSKNEIESILTLVRSTLDILEDKAYKSYDKLPEMTKHVLTEKDYQRTLLANETKCWEVSSFCQCKHT